MKKREKGANPSVSGDSLSLFGRRHFLGMLGLLAGGSIVPNIALRAFEGNARGGSAAASRAATERSSGGSCLYTKDKVPDPVDIFFNVQYPGKAPVRLAAHYWYNADAANAGRRCPAIVELNPYRRRDGMIYGDSAFYPYFSYNEYICFRVDLQGSGDSEGVLADEYTDEEMSYCVQVLEQVARHPLCDGNVAMMGASWSAINSLMVASRDDCPEALKAILAICGSDDRYNDDIHYMGGAMIQDNVGWPSSMWGWLSLPPDPLSAGEGWKEMWRERIGKAEHWFKYWGAHQSRDPYWSDTSLAGRYDKVKVPVYILSGYQDGYKNPVLRAVEGLSAAGMPVRALLGPWGHSTPDGGYPGPRIDWLPELLTSWFDRWLKGIEPDPESQLPQMTLWLGESKEPNKSTCKDEKGRWVAEDSGWSGRVEEKLYYLRPDGSLTGKIPKKSGGCRSSGKLLLETKMYETSSYGHCHNDDLPGDQSYADAHSLRFDSSPLKNDMDCFGRPRVELTLSCDKPLASIAVRLCEISPLTGESHLVTYRFFNLCYRGGDMSEPEPINPGQAFKVVIPLNVMGHTFKRGWKIRLSISPSFFPTMWQSPEIPRIMVLTGPPGPTHSRLVLPLRRPRPEDERMKELLPKEAEILCVDAEDYVPTVTARAESNTRRVEHISEGKRKGIKIHKTFDSGRVKYGGPLQDLWVDEVAEENFQMMDDDPLSMEGFSSFKAQLERSVDGTDWKVRCETSARVWTEKGSDGIISFNYRASIQTFIADESGVFQPFGVKVVSGSIPRRWV